MWSIISGEMKHIRTFWNLLNILLIAITKNRCQRALFYSLQDLCCPCFIEDYYFPISRTDNFYIKNIFIFALLILAFTIAG